MFFCGLNWENIEHLSVKCLKIKIIWSHLSNVLSSNIEFCEGITIELLLRMRKCSDTICLSSVIVVVLWMVWETRCNVIFRGIQPNLEGIVFQAIEHVKECTRGIKDKMGKFLLNLEHSPYSYLIMFYDIAWKSLNTPVSMGFIITTTAKRIVIK